MDGAKVLLTTRGVVEVWRRVGTVDALEISCPPEGS